MHADARILQRLIPAPVVLQGVDRVMCVNAADASTLLVRQYRIRLKKTGTKVRHLLLRTRLTITVASLDAAPGSSLLTVSSNSPQPTEHILSQVSTGSCEPRRTLP
jgi:hypothetical protein